MEHAKSEQESLELWEFVRLGLCEVTFIKFTKGSSDVGFKILWCLISNLESVLKNRLWNNFLMRETWWLR
jgi:hypothetical protein